MDKGKSTTKALATSLQNLDLNPESNVESKSSIRITHPQLSGLLLPKKIKPPSLVSLCIGVIGRNLEDIVADLGEIAINLPADINRCTKVTATGISDLVKHCHSLETLRCGGCPRSDKAARRCPGIFKPDFIELEEDSWEELDTKEIASGAESLRWLVWPNIDKNSLEDFSAECPRISVNPKSSPYGFMGTRVPWEALQNIILDDAVVKDIDPKTWTMHVIAKNPISPILSSTSSPELSVAEKFRLAFEERDNRLAPKRAKNARQHQRRAVRDLMLMSTRAKAMVWASQASKSLHS